MYALDSSSSHCQHNDEVFTAEYGAHFTGIITVVSQILLNEGYIFIANGPEIMNILVYGLKNE